MIWNRLKSNKCPNCNAELKTVKPAPSKEHKLFVCSKDCGFFIRPEKFEHIVNSLYKPKQQREVIDNQEALNNL